MSKLIDRRGVMAGGVLLGAAALVGPGSAQPESAVTTRRGFGWVRDRPDPSDRFLKAPAFAEPAPRPKSVDLTAKMPHVYDQGPIGSCTANAIAAAVQHARRVHDKPDDFVPSRLFIYYQERKMERSIYTDSGAQIRDGIASIAEFGVPPEPEWPYDNVPGHPVTGVFPPNARSIMEPPKAVMERALPFKTISYAPLKQDAAVLESCLASGYPFIFGYTVFDNFDSDTKWLRTPGAGDRITPYGHAVLAVGYDQTRRVFRIRNSWGADANDHGYFDMDYDYVLASNLTSDFWVVYQTLGFLEP